MNSAELTTAWILRAAAAYIQRHGYYEPVFIGIDPEAERWDAHSFFHHYDPQPACPLTPPASVPGAIAMVVYGRPIPNLAYGDKVERRQYLEAVEEYNATAWLSRQAGLGRSPADEAIAGLLTAARAWERDFLRCPECGEPAYGLPPGSWPLAGFSPIPRYRHEDGTELCPVYGEHGVTPAEPVLTGGF